MILKPLEFLYHVLSSLKNVLYDCGWLKSEALNVPVISIGNLSFGGTGKTPFIEWMAQQFPQKKIVIICRNYGVRTQGTLRVDLSSPQAASVYGDEAVLLQKKLPHCQVWSGPHKGLTARASLVDKPDLILVDDGFSHRALKRDFDLVLFDATQIGREYFRESLGSLRRAQAVVFTKTQAASTEKLETFKNRLRKKFPHLQRALFDSTSRTELDFAKDQPLYAFCGVAKPETFRHALMSQGFDLRHLEVFSDHQSYPSDLQVQIFQRYRDLLSREPRLKLVTTEKDRVKLTHPELVASVHVAQYKIEMNLQNRESLLEKIRSNI